MRLLPALPILLGAVTSALGQVIVLDYPTDGSTLYLGQDFTSRVTVPASPISCVSVGIALTIASCDNDYCPQPTERLGSVLYVGSFTPTPHPDGFYEEYSLQVPAYMTPGPAVFDLAYFCLLGGGPIPDLEFRNASVTIEP